MQLSDTNKPRVSKLELFLTFSRITLSSFGGALFWARRGIVERQRWLTEREFAEFLTIGQLLPGPNVLNLTVLVGYRFGGWTGAAVSVVGYLGWPFLVAIANLITVASSRPAATFDIPPSASCTCGNAPNRWYKTPMAMTIKNGQPR